ncbi:MAG: hypothetical protein HW391_1361 [Chloroflexi bacterium]|nr:hypothetical protein [Chloroflexota bacterium]
MHRRAIALPAVLVAISLIVGACGSATPALTDPTEILTRAVEALGKAKSLHIEATVDGTISLDLTGSGTASDLTLGGTTLDADVDIENGDIRMHLAVPAMLGLTADVVVVGEDSYTRTSFTGEKYKKGSAAASGVPVDTSNLAESLKMLEEWLKKPEIAPKKLDDAACGSSKGPR